MKIHQQMRTSNQFKYLVILFLQGQLVWYPLSTGTSLAMPGPSQTQTIQARPKTKMNCKKKSCLDLIFHLIQRSSLFKNAHSRFAKTTVKLFQLLRAWLPRVCGLRGFPLSSTTGEARRYKLGA